MRHLVKVLFLLVFMSATANAGDRWTPTDTALEATFFASMAMDTAQTLHIVRNPDIYFERNPILGEHPSKAKVVTYMTSMSLLHAGIAYVLPDPWRNIWQAVWIGLELETVQHNRDIGIGVRLHF